MGSLLGIDYGTKRVGLAVADEEIKIASPLKIMEINSVNELIEKISHIIKDYSVNKIIIGSPLNENSEETEISKEVDDFITQLESIYPEIEIVKVNEFLSSKFAEDRMKNIQYKVKRIDSEVARLLLQNYLNPNEVN